MIALFVPCWRAIAVFAVLSVALPAAHAQAAGDLERGRKIVRGSCMLCHGENGESSSELFPNLAAQNAAYIAKQLTDFKSGARKSSAMEPFVRELSDADIKAVSAYFSSRPPVADAVKDPELAAVGRYIYQQGNRFSGVAACATCHGPAAAGSAELPRLAGQNAAYIENRMNHFRRLPTGREGAAMRGIAAAMTTLEIKAVAEYLAGKK